MYNLKPRIDFLFSEFEPNFLATSLYPFYLCLYSLKKIKELKSLVLRSMLYFFSAIVSQFLDLIKSWVNYLHSLKKLLTFRIWYVKFTWSYLHQSDHFLIILYLALFSRSNFNTFPVFFLAAYFCNSMNMHLSFFSR